MGVEWLEGVSEVEDVGGIVQVVGRLGRRRMLGRFAAGPISQA